MTFIASILAKIVAMTTTVIEAIQLIVFTVQLLMVLKNART